MGTDVLNDTYDRMVKAWRYMQNQTNARKISLAREVLLDLELEWIDALTDENFHSWVSLDKDYRTIVRSTLGAD